jgi:hypothetical protein
MSATDYIGVPLGSAPLGDAYLEVINNSGTITFEVSVSDSWSATIHYNVNYTEAMSVEFSNGPSGNVSIQKVLTEAILAGEDWAINILKNAWLNTDLLSGDSWLLSTEFGSNIINSLTSADSFAATINDNSELIYNLLSSESFVSLANTIANIVEQVASRSIFAASVTLIPTSIEQILFTLNGARLIFSIDDGKEINFSINNGKAITFRLD